MAFTFPTNNINNHFHDENTFTAVINRLKSQNALPNHCFLKDYPFFNIPSLPKEVQMKELFENSCDITQCRTLLRNVVPLQNGEEYKILPQNYSPVSVMSFSQITLYKVLPCPNAQCPNYPREIATHNQYKDFEYQCPFYHHERDRRRIVVSVSVDEEFVYKANYYEEGRRNGDKEKYSQNYFESMFHPLYYKMFRCKRDFCNTSAFCPFFHSEDEKRTWDDIFCDFIGKDRVTYIKDKQASPTKKAKAQNFNRRRKSEEDELAKENYGHFVATNHFSGKSSAKNYRALHLQQPDQAMLYVDMIENSKPSYNGNWKSESGSLDRKDSEDSSFEEKFDRYGFFGRLQAVAKGY